MYGFVGLFFYGVFVTHYFFHSNDDFTMMCAGFQNHLFRKKIDCFPPLKDHFLEGRHRLSIVYSVEINDFRMML
jgi:hypothetical protein